MSYNAFVLFELPRQLNRPFHLRSISWATKHVFYNKHRTLELPHFCCSFYHEPVMRRSIVNGQLYENSSAGTFMDILPAGTTLHTLQAGVHDELMFTLVPEDYEPFMNMLHPLQGKFTMNAHIESVFQEIMETMEHIFVPGAADRMDGLFMRFMEETTLDIKTQDQAQKADPAIYEIISYMSLHCMEEITLESVAKNFGISRRTLYRLWGEHFPDTPADFLLKKRLEYAKRLLLTTNFNIQTVALNSGFSNPLYFTQCFRNATGETPTGWRKKRSELYSVSDSLDKRS